ncbi:helix-turn-helix domain-containing protein [Sinorhizobium meliloti]|uniref:helix-turn-helix domain-containing protein n=1 Tax=Rhizobium meliloti TaxID=382 RepID=UPI001297FF3E|nr:helix-turn-helix domain-containing protein [Sinorhizobium meliloti]MDX0199084.1 hypothetical protein [Sinorhizobium meliloti]MDX0236525.1 hypothetical protein [Sinorhizobium meliloti]MQU91853.1 hypothetical protein [Sinorhizobium meliloti]
MSKAPAKGQKHEALYALLWMPKLSPAARAVGGWLVWHANASTGRCDPGQARLLKETGFSPRTIKNAVQELVARGIVSRELRGHQSSSYEVHWQKLSDLVAEYEARARSGEVVIAAEERRKGGAENCTPLVQKTAPYPVQETAPKHWEGNSVKEHVFRVGTISVENGAHSSRSQGVEKNDVLGVNAGSLETAFKAVHSDDTVAARVLSYQKDHAFLAGLDRALRDGRLFSRPIADAIYERLEAIHDSDDATQGDPIAGRAYRLLETDLYREDAA